jgi:uncharacterized protein with FMN-binding domain
MIFIKSHDLYKDEVKLKSEISQHAIDTISVVRSSNSDKLNTMLEVINSDKSIVEFELKKRSRKEDLAK